MEPRRHKDMEPRRHKDIHRLNRAMARRKWSNAWRAEDKDGS